MPVLIPALQSSIAGQMASANLTGSFVPNLASATAMGTKNYLNSLIVRGTAIGSKGQGAGTGTMILNPSTGSSIIKASFISSGISGESHGKLASAIAKGIATTINLSAIVNTTVTGVANGSETGVFQNPNPLLASSQVLTGLTSHAIVGTMSTNMAQAIGKGIAQWFQTAVITTVVVGTPVFPFNTTTGFGVGRVS